MLIRCDIREHDNLVQLQNTKYHFKKDKNGVLACDVLDEHHAHLILSMPDFRVYVAEADLEHEPGARVAPVASGAPEDEDEEDDPNFGAPVDPELPPPGVDGDAMALGDAADAQVIPAPKADIAPPGLPVDEAPALDAEATKRLALADMTIDELHDLYHQKYGKAAPSTTKHETLVARLMEA